MNENLKIGALQVVIAMITAVPFLFLVLWLSDKFGIPHFSAGMMFGMVFSLIGDAAQSFAKAIIK